MKYIVKNHFVRILLTRDCVYVSVIDIHPDKLQFPISHSLMFIANRKEPKRHYDVIVSIVIKTNISYFKSSIFFKL